MAKLYIELNETDIQVKLDELLGKRISELSEKYINDKIAGVLDKKLDRLDMEKVIQKATRNLLIEAFGIPGYQGRYRVVLREIGLELMSEQLKKGIA